MNEKDQIGLIKRLDALILKVVPEAQSLDKYGGTLYTINPDEKEGQFCGVFPYANHVQIAFSQGAKLKDSANILVGKGKLRRHINFTEADSIDEPMLSLLVKEAALLPD